MTNLPQRQSLKQQFKSGSSSPLFSLGGESPHFLKVLTMTLRLLPPLPDPDDDFQGPKIEDMCMGMRDFRFQRAIAQAIDELRDVNIEPEERNEKAFRTLLDALTGDYDTPQSDLSGSDMGTREE